MKRFTKFFVVALVAGAAGSFSASAQVPVLNSGVEPVVSTSFNVNKLPKSALKFLRAHYGDCTVVSCEDDIEDSRYEVELSNGTTVEFDYDGRVMELESETTALPEDAIKDLLPDDAYSKLNELGLNDNIDKYGRMKRGYEIEVTDGQPMSELFFNHDGELIAHK